MTVRAPDTSEVEQLARFWHTGWNDAHATILPAELARVRTRESLRERMSAALTDVRVVGAHGAPLGFFMIKGDQVYQFYVTAEARGTGVAAELMKDAEARIAATGAGVAWLTCAIGNERAARFYEKQGWQRRAL